MDSFLIEYRQLEPEQSYPILEVLDIPDQKNLEVYLGRDYAVQVVGVKSGLKSRPWSTTISTKPSAVTSLQVAENGSCLAVDWEVSPNSGADSFLIRYRQQSANSNLSVTLPGEDRSVHLCDGIVPGTVYLIGVAAKKGKSTSEETIKSYTVRPSSPTDFRIFPDITKGKYRLIFDLPVNSNYDGCHVSVVSETLETFEDDGEVDEKEGNKSCSILLPLFPGERFEFTLSTFVENATSSKLHRSVVLTPAFDMNGFGLSLQESQNGVKLSWPQSDVFMSRMRDIWNKGDPHGAAPLVVGALKKGTCYKVQIFTVTKSGIVSETRYNDFFRMSAPPVNISVHAVTRSSAVLHAAFISPDEADPECVLNAVVLDMHSHVVLDKTLKAQSKTFTPIELNGLRPFHKYTVNSKNARKESWTFMPVINSRLAYGHAGDMFHGRGHFPKARRTDSVYHLYFGTFRLHSVFTHHSTVDILHHAGQARTGSVSFRCVFVV
ncbi:fibronectin type III domain protein [Teladorsagia circumcincta]|uniref:Fibronectin type III domain protein n=1 Tax=Teladorsagia circumcincta TaxID=45464 RepID=A0A2G9UYP2_TELCI|nr:fibronectin type III domain protein [Teladorsagia circumcincta]